MKNTCSIPAATAAALWRYNNLLCGKQLEMHDEYFDATTYEEHLSSLVIKIWNEIHDRKTDYWKRGLKKAASQFIVNSN